MWKIGVWEQNEGLTQLVEDLSGSRSKISTGNHPSFLLGQRMDLLVVSPIAVCRARTATISCRTVLLPDPAGPLAYSLFADRVVSYGLSPRDTITLSSLEGTHICVAVQRELIRLDGSVVERQELVLPRREGQSPELLLVQAGLRLLLGPLDEEKLSYPSGKEWPTSPFHGPA